MIDLHSHILPGLDDGARDLAVSLAMARIYSDHGVECVACTPHILPGVFNNSAEKIRSSVDLLQKTLNNEGIPLRLTTGADNHVTPDFVGATRAGRLLTLGDTRYILVEPPHHVVPARLEELFFDIILANYVPILTHPERLTWIESKYKAIQDMVERGVWMQVTSGSLLGSFGGRARFWAERMLCEGLVHILATDAHDSVKRRPNLPHARAAAAKLVGDKEAESLVFMRPKDVLSNRLSKDCIAVDVMFSGNGRKGILNYVENHNAGGWGSVAQRLRRFFT